MKKFPLSLESIKRAEAVLKLQQATRIGLDIWTLPSGTQAWITDYRISKNQPAAIYYKRA